MGTLTSADIEISNRELGKYANTIHRNGKNYARVYYNDGVIEPEKTYSNSYLKEHGIGKYAGGGSSSGSSSGKSSRGRKGLLSAAAGGVGGVIKTAIENEKEKERERNEEYERIREAVDARVEPYVESLKEKYPKKKATSAQILLWLPILLEEAESYQQLAKEKDIDEIDQQVYDKCMKETAGHAARLGKRLKKLYLEKYRSPEIQEIIKKVDIISGNRLRRRAIFIIIPGLLLLMFFILVTLTATVA